jgi:lipid-binding SYLF domain-containing protein
MRQAYLRTLSRLPTPDEILSGAVKPPKSADKLDQVLAKY